jgi:hypothetical protein
VDPIAEKIAQRWQVKAGRSNRFPIASPRSSWSEAPDEAVPQGLPMTLQPFPYVAAVWAAALQSYLVFSSGQNWRRFITSEPLVLKGQQSSLGAIVDTVKHVSRDMFMKSPETVLRYLLEVLGLLYSSNPELRKHVQGYSAKYQFRFTDHEAPVAAEFRSGRLRVEAAAIAGPDVTVTFTNAQALGNLLMAHKPDLFSAILKQDIAVEGNLTYVYKLAFLAKHLQRMITGY